ncbi:hypothetical protein HDU76_001651 [Blyttiomyces sp. JEL0837]|nr:hypothetical protein HDU76_001651 [Blyttiomyces sp. JEL0837]
MSAKGGSNPRTAGSGRRKSEKSDAGSSKGIEAPPEVVYKMSKKIAQLTKVIYYLNTKNEDHNVEIQSLIDAYEDELSEAIKDASQRIRDLESKVEECEIQIKTHEDVIQSYVETLSNKDEEIGLIKANEGQLRDALQVLQEEVDSLKEKALSHETAGATQRVPAHDISQDQLGEVVQKYEAELKSLRATHSEQIEQIQAQNAKNIKTYVEDCKNAQDQLRETMTNTSRQLEEQRRGFQAEIHDLRENYENKIEGMVLEREAIEKELNKNLAEQTRKSDEFRERAEKLEEELNGISSQLKEAQESINTKDIEITLTKSQLSDRTAQVASLRQDLDITSIRLNELNDRASTLDQELSAKIIQLAQTEAANKTMQENIDHAQNQLKTLGLSLDSALGTIRELNDKIHDLNRAKAESEVVRIEKERALRQLGEDMANMRETLLKDKELALQSQAEEMEKKFAGQLENKLKELTDVHTKALEIKINRIQELEERLTTQAQENHVELEKMKDNTEAIKMQMQEKINLINAEKNACNTKNDELSAQLDDKNAQLAKYQASLLQLQNTVKALEVDKADLFQKMVRIDDQIRGELHDKFRKEKMEWEDEREWEEARTELQAKCDDAEEQVKVMLKAMMELKEDHARKIAQATDQFQQTLEQERKNWEFEVSARETQLKMEQKIAATNIEKKHQIALDELEANHRKQLDEVRNLNTKNALAAKKEAEALRNAEINKLKEKHLEETEKLNQEHVAELAETVLSMNVQRIAELKNLNELHESEMNAKIEELNNANTTMEELNLEISELNEQIKIYKDDIALLKEEVARKNEELALVKQKAVTTLKEREEHLFAEHQTDIDRLNDDHIQAAQKMLKEFEQAQTILKKEIAKLTKQLEDADVKYQNREPREVDVQKIFDLEEDIKRRKRKTMTLTEELEYCKLELRNREANFNKIFNKSPLVGVIQPTHLNGKIEKINIAKRESKSDQGAKLPPLFSMQDEKILPTISVIRPAPQGA